MNHKAVLFDYDGVIVDSLESVIKRWQESSKMYGSGVTVDKEFVRNNPTGAWRIFYAKKLGIPAENIDKAGKLYQKMAEEDIAHNLFEGIKEIIPKIADDYPLYILSSNYSKIIIKNLEYHGLRKFFKDVAGDEEAGGVNKNDSEFILAALRKWKLSADDVVYVGDTVDEVSCSKNAGVKSIGCTWGYQARNLILEAKPDAVADSPSQLPAAISEVFFHQL